MSANPTSALKIEISAGGVSLPAEFNESTTARQIWQHLPLEAEANRWGDEIYFKIPVAAGMENPQAVVAVGDLCYWPPGEAFCIFFGRTPASRGQEIRPASPVNVVGRVLGDATLLQQVQDGESVRLERA